MARQLARAGDVAYSEDGRRVGRFLGDPAGRVFLSKRTLDPTKHKQVYPERGWATDAVLLDQLMPHSYVRITTATDEHFGSVADHRRFGILVDHGYGRQVLLPDRYWRVVALDMRPEEERMMIAPTVPPPLATPLPIADGLESWSGLVTPQVAERWLRQYHYPQQRRLDAGQVALLIAALQRGAWEPTAIMFGQLPDGARYLMDGQHRLWAIAESGITAPLSVQLKQCADAAALAHLYSCLDQHRKRSFTESMRPYDLVTEFGLTQQRQVLDFQAAAAYLITGFRDIAGIPDARLRTQRLQVMRAWADEARRAFSLMEGVPTEQARRYRSAAVLPVMLVTLRYQRERAEAFWGRVVRGVELRAGTPEYALNQYVIAHPIGGKMRPPLYARAVAACWNAYLEERPLKIVRPTDVRAPIVIKGTPYTGKGVAA